MRNVEEIMDNFIDDLNQWKNMVYQFLTAHGWLHYAEMHCRHHFRQKERIEKRLRHDFH